MFLLIHHISHPHFPHFSKFQIQSHIHDIFFIRIMLMFSKAQHLPYIKLTYYLGVLARLVIIVERIPNLCKELILLCSLSIVPGFSLALVAPVAAFQYKTGTSLEVMSKLAGKLKRSFPVAHLHLC